MEHNNRDKFFEVRKTFGLGVLMKLIKKNDTGITIETVGDRFVSNVGVDEIKGAVEVLTRSNNIRLKV